MLAVVTFWLFAQTTTKIGPLMAGDVGMPMPLMNIAISLSALFSGMFIVVLGGLGDRYGRVRVVFLGNVLNIVGSLLIAFAFDALASPMILLGRILQGLAAGAIMPCTMALLKDYWEGAQRQRAVSMWSIGSWGGSGLTAIFGGFMASTVLGWRSIFVICALVSVASIALMRQIPESAPQAGRPGKTDWAGIISLAVALAALPIVVTQGSSIGWTNLLTWALLAIFLLAFGAFVNAELKAPYPLVDFKLFTNSVFTGATISNFLINGTAGALTVSLWVLQGEAAAALRPAQAHALGLPGGAGLHPAADGHPHHAVAVHDPGHRGVLAVRPGPGVLCHALDRRRAHQPARRPGRGRLGDLQDGLVAGRCVRRGGLGGDLYGPVADGPGDRRHGDRILRPPGQPRGARGGDGRDGLQRPDDDGRADLGDHFIPRQRKGAADPQP